MEHSPAVGEVFAVGVAFVLALLVVLVAGLLRSHAEILRVLDRLGAGLDPDASAPAQAPGGGPRPVGARAAVDVAGMSPLGDALKLAVVDTPHPTLLAFLTSGCSSCLRLWETLGRAPAGLPTGTRIVVVTQGSERESPARVLELAPADVPVVMSSEAWEAYAVPVAPFFVLVDGPSAAIVGEGSANTWEHVASLVARGVAESGALGERGRAPRTHRRRNGSAREADVDRALRDVGIEPGHPSLYRAPGGPGTSNPS